ncbi:MAG: dihydrofolate reductase [Actinobacteria bacterium]|nr:dihydrofolate reductase [Actinomycetota bacterium]
MSQVVWCQWSDIDIPDGFKLLHSESDLEDSEKLSQINVYIPKYMGGAKSLAHIREMPNLKLVQVLTAGFDDVLSLIPEGVRLANARGLHDLSTAELTLTLTLASKANVANMISAQENKSWLRDVRPSIIDAKIAIVGYGSVGQEIARVFRPFTDDITGYTRSGSNGTHQMSKLDSELDQYDIVILITPLTDETRGMFDLKRMQLMKPGALLVNMARGPVVVTSDLIRILKTGHIQAAVDVTDPEPLPNDHPMWEAPNLLISPHVGGNSTAFPGRAKKLIAAQLNRLANGEPITNVVFGD